MSNKQPVNIIDGRYLYYTFLAGASRVLQNQAELNRINVFPVNDKDTGTNLTSTMRSIMDCIRPDRSFAATANVIAEAALVGARGNSGVIFAQFFYGLSLETNARHSLTFSEFADTIKRAVGYVYEAVANPVEGTMLTVISDWTDFLYSKRGVLSDFDQALIESMGILHNSLERTKEKLAILRKLNLVDAGAKGFVLFVEGIIDLIHSKNLRPLLTDLPQPVAEFHDEACVNETINYRYCTEVLVKNIKLGRADIQSLLLKYGDSVVVAGVEKNTRIHVHTNQPAELFRELRGYGTLSFQKADDMIRQNEVINNRKWKIAVVTDSTCDLSQELIDYYQIHLVPLNLNFGENQYLDKVTITPDHFYELLENTPEFPRTSQINERVFTNLYSHLASHYDAVISLHLSGSLSGTCLSSFNAAQRVSREFHKPIHVVDSKTLSGSLGLVVLRTARAIESGVPFPELAASVDQWIRKSRIFVSVKTMKYMVSGGRVSKPKGWFAALLNIKPIVSLDENGKAMLIGKTYSQQSNIKSVMKMIVSLIAEQKLWDYIVLHAHNPEGALKYTSLMRDVTGKEPISVIDISPVIGMNAGVGATAVSLMFN
jgi:DegV family protein with EDD domain